MSYLKKTVWPSQDASPNLWIRIKMQKPKGQRISFIKKNHIDLFTFETISALNTAFQVKLQTQNSDSELLTSSCWESNAVIALLYFLPANLGHFTVLRWLHWRTNVNLETKTITIKRTKCCIGQIVWLPSRTLSLQSNKDIPPLARIYCSSEPDPHLYNSKLLRSHVWKKLQMSG